MAMVEQSLGICVILERDCWLDCCSGTFLHTYIWYRTESFLGWPGVHPGSSKHPHPFWFHNTIIWPVVVVVVDEGVVVDGMPSLPLHLLWRCSRRSLPPPPVGSTLSHRKRRPWGPPVGLEVEDAMHHHPYPTTTTTMLLHLLHRLSLIQMPWNNWYIWDSIVIVSFKLCA